MPKAIYLCTPFCVYDCSHGVPCECWTDQHPEKGGRLHHFGAEWIDQGGDTKRILAHEWVGKAGKCKTEWLAAAADESGMTRPNQKGT